MIAVDTNILVYAHRRDAEFHGPAADCIRTLAEAKAAWAIPWPCLHEFYAISTHPRIYDPPSSRDQVIRQIDAWLVSPALVVLAEPEGYWVRLKAMLTAAKVSGPLVHDARIAALCTSQGVRELWTVDRDFGRFGSSLSVRNPLLS
jgi:toxin-antitoxin system PIN domain toxin